MKAILEMKAMLDTAAPRPSSEIFSKNEHLSTDAVPANLRGAPPRPGRVVLEKAGEVVGVQPSDALVRPACCCRRVPREEAAVESVLSGLTPPLRWHL